MYNGINGAISRARGEYDPINSVAAGALTGALFKSTGKKGRCLISIASYRIAIREDTYCLPLLSIF